MEINILGLVLVLIIVLLILILNIVKYGKIINDFFEPTTFYVVFLILFFGVNYTTDFEYSINTIFVVFIGSIAYILGYYSKFFKIFVNKKKIFLYDIAISITFKKYLLNTILISIANIVVLLLKLRSYNIGFYNFFDNMMLLAVAGKVGGYIWMIFTYPLEAMNYINIYRYLKGKKKLALIGVAIGQLIVSLSLFRTSRFAYIINLILLPLLLKMIFIDRKPKFSLKIIFYSILILPLMIILNNIRHGDFSNIDLSFSSLFGYIQDTLNGDTKPGRLLDGLIRFVDNNYFYNYGKYILYQILSIIPRAIWPDKPITSFCYEYTMLVFNRDPIINKETFTFTVFDSYSVFGYPSLIALQFIFGVFSRWIYYLLYNTKSVFVILFVLPFILNYINTLRGSFLDQISFFILFIVVNITIYYWFILFKKSDLTRID